MQKNQRIIDGICYTVNPIAPRASLKLGVRIAKTIVAPAATLLEGMLKAAQQGKKPPTAADPAADSAAEAEPKSLLDRKLDFSKVNIAVAFEKLATNMNEDDLLDITDQLLACVEYTQGHAQGAPLMKKIEMDVDADFRGHLKNMLAVAAFSLEVNYADFFGDLQGLAAKGGAMIALLTQTPTASPGKSGA